jgi:hypothetical protein
VEGIRLYLLLYNNCAPPMRLHAIPQLLLEHGPSRVLVHFLSVGTFLGCTHWRPYITSRHRWGPLLSERSIGALLGNELLSETRKGYGCLVERRGAKAPTRLGILLPS